MPSVRFPINVNLESIDGDVDRAKIVNGYAELASAQEVKVYSRPGLDLAQGSFAAFGQGVANSPDGQLFVVSGGNIYLPVPGLTASTALSTSGTNTESQPWMAAALNSTIYSVSYQNGIVRRTVPPYSAWSTVGTVGGSGSLRTSLISYSGKLWVMADTTVSTSVDGATWGTLANSPPQTKRLVGFGNTLFAYPQILGTGTSADKTYNTTQNGGASAWGTGNIVYAGTNTSLSHYAADNSRIVAVSGTGAAQSLDGSTWSDLTTNMGFNFSDTNQLSSFALLGGTIYVPIRTDGTTFTIHASSGGVSWASAGALTVGAAGTRDRFLFPVGGVLYGFFPVNTENYALFSFSDDGTLEGVTAASTVGVPEGEVVSIISTALGVSFIKSTTEAYTVSNGTFTRVSDAQYPTVTVRGAVYLNGRLYVMEPDGTIWNSAEDDFTSWAGTDFINAEFEADAGVCLAKQGEYVIALGQFTTEAFYDAANSTGSPLDPVGSAVMLIGCAHANSVAQVETSLVWVAQQKGQGSTFHKGRFVAFMRGYGAYERISTPDVEKVLDADAFTELYADILTIAGHVFYVLSLIDSDITLVYDFRSQLWYQWSLLTQGSAKSVSALTQSNGIATATSTSHGFSDGDQVTIAGANQAGYNLTVNVTRVDANTFTYPVDSATVSPATGTITATSWTEGALDISASCYFDNSQIVQLRETGDVYVLDVTGTSDNGAPIDFRIRTRLWDAGTGREKFQNGLEVQGDKVSSTGLVRYWDEDFTTATKFRRVDLSLRRPRVKRGGSFSRRAVEFRHTLTAKVGIAALEADIEMGEQ